jgi:hypothetical protein
MSHPGATLESFLIPQAHLNDFPWVTESISFEGFGICPAVESMQERIASFPFECDERELGIEKIRQTEDLNRVFAIGGNGDGHRYYLSAVSHRFYVWWHFGPECVEPCDTGRDHFIDWLLDQKSSDKPQGRPWSTFEVLPTAETVTSPSGQKITLCGDRNLSTFVLAHSICFPLAEIEALAAGVLSNPVIYRNETSWSVIDPVTPLLIETFHHHRGFNTYLNFSINNEAVANKDLVCSNRGFSEIPSGRWIPAS